MNQAITRTLLAIAAFLLAALLLGVFAGPARGLVLCSVSLLCLAACRMKLPALGLETDVPGEGAAGDAPLQRLLARLGLRAAGKEAIGRSGPRGGCVGVCVLDAEHHVLWCNASAALHFGIRSSEAIGLPVGRVIFAQEFDAYLAAADFTRPLKLETARGESLSLSLVPHLHSQWLLLSRDVTLETRAEVLRRDGVADALHELCTPVTVLAGHLDSLRRQRLDSWRSAEHLTFMEQQCLRMQSTIGDLVKLWSLESSPPPSTEERVDVPALLAGIRADMEALSGGRHAIALDAERGLGLYGRAAELASAFRNLAMNAIRYTPPGGAVWLVWRQTAGGAELAVEDNGIGIAAEHIPRLAERFYQVNRDFSRAAGGSGLGLAIVKNVLTRHDAALVIDSQPGRGSRFCAKFPAGRVLTLAAPVPATGGWPGDEVEAEEALEIEMPAPATIRLPDIGEKMPAH